MAQFSEDGQKMPFKIKSKNYRDFFDEVKNLIEKSN